MLVAPRLRELAAIEPGLAPIVILAGAALANAAVDDAADYFVSAALSAGDACRTIPHSSSVSLIPGGNMSQPEEPANAVARPKLTLDWWAVLLSLAAALLVRFNVIHSVKW